MSRKSIVVSQFNLESTDTSDNHYEIRQKLYLNYKQQSSLQLTKQIPYALKQREQILKLLQQSIKFGQNGNHENISKHKQKLNEKIGRHSLIDRDNNDYDTSELDEIHYFLKRMELFETEIKIFSTFSNLSKRVETQIKSSLNEIKRLKQMMGADQRGDIEYILKMDELNWNFNDNENINYYRARAIRFDHINPNKLLLAPIYQCKWDISSHLGLYKTPFSIRIHLNEFNEYPFTIKLKPTTKIEKALKVIYKRLNNDNIDLNDLILKVYDEEEYLYGIDLRMIHFQCVQNALRWQMLLHLSLSFKPNKLNNNDSNHDPHALYQEKIPTKTPVLMEYDYLELDTNNICDIEYIPFESLNYPICFQISRLSNINQQTFPLLDTQQSLYVNSFIFFGDTILETSKCSTKYHNFGTTIHWMEWQNLSNISWNSLPRESRIAFIIYQTDNIILGYVVLQLINEIGHLVAGEHQLGLWSINSIQTQHDYINDMKLDEFIFRSTNCSNKATDDQFAVLTVKFHEFALPVAAPMYFDDINEPNENVIGVETNWNDISIESKQRIICVLFSDPCFKLTDPRCKDDIWMARYFIMENIPNMLYRLIQCTFWMNKHYISEIHNLLFKQWKITDTFYAMKLLDYSVHDTKVRQFAVKMLDRICSDDILELILLPLVQCIKYESYHDSALVRWLINRSLSSPHRIGHKLFWYLKEEIDIKDQYKERYTVIFEEYVIYCNNQRIQFTKQLHLISQLEEVNNLIKNIQNRKKNKMTKLQLQQLLETELNRINELLFDEYGSISLPTNPWIKVNYIRYKKCKIFNSKMLPLFIVFDNDFSLIFKCGDDLRQDQLIYSLLKIMDKCWLSNGLDLKLITYQVLATGCNSFGFGMGFIEVIQSASTISEIEMTFGGGAKGAFKKTPIYDYLKYNQSKTGLTMDEIIDNYIKSTAGFVVATYILGIGDRHNDNIMVKQNGCLLHIDFGHFLGNFKSKFGFKRERSAFVLTKEMIYVMGNQFKTTFKSLAVNAYKIIRNNSYIFEILLLLMINADLTELKGTHNIQYVRNMLHLDKSEKEAIKIFTDEINKSVNTTWRTIDNFIHNVKHY